MNHLCEMESFIRFGDPRLQLVLDNWDSWVKEHTMEISQYQLFKDMGPIFSYKIPG